MAKSKGKEPRNQIINIRTTVKVKNSFNDKAHRLGVKSARLFDELVLGKPVFCISSSSQIAAMLFKIHSDINNLPDACNKQDLHNAISSLVDMIELEKEQLLKNMHD